MYYVSHVCLHVHDCIHNVSRKMTRAQAEKAFNSYWNKLRKSYVFGINCVSVMYLHLRDCIHNISRKMITHAG
jgi:hypothetical protein